MSLVSQLQLVMSRIGAEFKSVRTAVAAKADKTTTVTAGAGLSGGGDLSASRTLNVVYGTVVGTAAQGNDSRLSDARTPTAHNHDASAIVSGTLADARLPARLGVGGYAQPSGGDWNNAIETGFYSYPDGTNRPPGTGGWGIVIVHQLAANPDYAEQMYRQGAQGTGVGPVYRRIKNAGTWGAWVANILEGDTRLTDARTPTTHTHDDRYYTETEINNNYYTRAQSDAGYVSVARAITAGTGLTGGGTLAADRSLAVSYGTTAGTAAQGNDSRLSDARTPLAHNHSAADITTGTLAEARLPGRIQNSALLVTDWNVAVANGWFYSAYSAANAPSYPYVGNPPIWYGEVQTGNGYFVQTVTRAYRSEGDTASFQRSFDPASGTWSAWYKVLQSATEIQAQGDFLYTPKAVGTATRDTTIRHVKMATTTNITLTGATTTIDGVAVTNNCRILVKNQNVASQNGVYIGSVGSSPWSRANDLDTTEKWNNLAPSPVVHIRVQEGGQGGTDWIAKFPNNAQLGIDALNFTQTSVSGMVLVAPEVAGAWWGNVLVGNSAQAYTTTYTANAVRPQANLAEVWMMLNAAATGNVNQAVDYQFEASIAGGAFQKVTGMYTHNNGGGASPLGGMMRAWVPVQPGQTLAIRCLISVAGGGPSVNFGMGTVGINWFLTSASSLAQATFPYFKGTNRATSVYTANTDIGFATIAGDTAGGWYKTAVNRYTIPQTGLYRITFAWKNDSTARQPSGIVLKNGTYVNVSATPSSAAFVGGLIVHTEQCNAGDTISARLNIGMTTQVDTGADNNYMIVEWVPTSVAQPVTGSDTGWINMILQSGHSWWGTGWQVPQYRKIGTQVFLRGLVNSGTNPTGQLWAAPGGFVPTTSTMFFTRMGDGSVRRTDLATTGALSFPEGATASTFYPLDHISYFVD